MGRIRVFRNVVPQIVFTLVMLGSAGCATTPTPMAQSVEVPADRRFALPPGDKAGGTVTIVRDGGFLGSGCYYDVHVNRTRVARIGSGERIQVPVPAGEVLLRVGRDTEGRALCAPESAGDWRQRETQIRPGENKVFRVLIDSVYQVDIVRAESD